MAITQAGRDEVISRGYRHRTNYLVAQGHYTLGLVEEDPEVAEILGLEFIGEVQAALSRLSELVRDRDLAATESKEAARAQGDAMQAGKIWRRAFINRALAARLRHPEIPADAGAIQARGSNPQAISRDINRLVELGRAHLPILSGFGISDSFLSRCAELARRLSDIDERQELARLSRLPEKVRDLYYQKGLVYLAVKQINHIGRSAFAEDGGRSSRYNLDILYRRQRRGSPDLASAPEAGEASA